MKWVTFTRRTGGSKLMWLERTLWSMGVPTRRQGESMHAPILQVPEKYETVAWSVLTEEIDDMCDNDPYFGGVS